MNTLTHNELEHCFRLSAQHELSPQSLGYEINKLSMEQAIAFYEELKTYTAGHDIIWKESESMYVINYNSIVKLNAHLFKETHTPKKDKANMHVFKDPQAKRIHELEQRLAKAEDAYRFMEAIVAHQQDILDKQDNLDKQAFDKLVETTFPEYQHEAPTPESDEHIYNRVKPLRDHIKVTKTDGYAHYTFIGSYDTELEQLLGHKPTNLEIVFIVDQCLYNFGYQCTIDHDKHTFFGKVNID